MRYANKKRRDLIFNVGEFVLLNSKNIRLKVDGPKKLMHRYLDPFEILNKVGPVAYKLRIPASMEVHDVFHVSLLRPYKTEEGSEFPPPALLPDGQIEYKVEAVLRHDDDADNERFYYVKYIGDEVPSWELEVHPLNCKDKIADYFKQSGQTNVRAKRVSKRGVRSKEQSAPGPEPLRPAHSTVTDVPELDISTPLVSPAEQRKSARTHRPRVIFE